MWSILDVAIFFSFPFFDIPSQRKPHEGLPLFTRKGILLDKDIIARILWLCYSLIFSGGVTLRRLKKTADCISDVRMVNYSHIEDEGILGDILVAHRAEVKGMVLTEYNEAQTMQHFFNDGFNDGKKAEEQDILERIVKNLMRENPSLTKEDALKKAKAIIS